MIPLKNPPVHRTGLQEYHECPPTRSRPRAAKAALRRAKESAYMAGKLGAAMGYATTISGGGADNSYNKCHIVSFFVRAA